MRSPIGGVGPRGIALLAATGLIGLVLAVHGWTGSGAHSALGSITSGPAATSSAQPGAPGSTPKAGPATGPPSASASTRAGAGGSAGNSQATTSTPGPLLSSQSYASYAFVVWPGTPTAAATAALTGLSVTVHRQSGGLSVSAAANGQPGASHFYPNGVRVYIVEASMGDDSGGSDYNLGDDGLVVTDSRGRIIS